MLAPLMKPVPADLCHVQHLVTELSRDIRPWETSQRAIIRTRRLRLAPPVIVIDRDQAAKTSRGEIAMRPTRGDHAMAELKLSE